MFRANIIKKHLTLIRSMQVTDKAASLSPDGIKMLNVVIKKFNPEEKIVLKKFKYWK